MNYFRLEEPDTGRYIGKISTLNFIKYQQEHDLMLCAANESSAQYVIFRDTFYRVPWLNKEPDKLKGKYKTVNAVRISEEEYYSEGEVE